MLQWSSASPMNLVPHLVAMQTEVNASSMAHRFSSLLGLKVGHRGGAAEVHAGVGEHACKPPTCQAK